MPFSKFDPHRPAGEDPLEPTSAEARRRILFLRWATVITWVFTAIGFGFIAYWLLD